MPYNSFTFWTVTNPECFDHAFLTTSVDKKVPTAEKPTISAFNKSTANQLYSCGISQRKESVTGITHSVAHKQFLQSLPV